MFALHPTLLRLLEELLIFHLFNIVVRMEWQFLSFLSAETEVGQQFLLLVSNGILNSIPEHNSKIHGVGKNSSCEPLYREPYEHHLLNLVRKWGEGTQDSTVFFPFFSISTILTIPQGQVHS